MISDNDWKFQKFVKLSTLLVILTKIKLLLTINKALLFNSTDGIMFRDV